MEYSNAQKVTIVSIIMRRKTFFTFPTKKNPHVTTYDIPGRYIPQLLCKMEVWESSELWLLCGTTESVTLFQCFHDKPLLQKLFSMKDDLYASEKPNIPTRLHPSVPEMKENLRKYISTHSFQRRISSIDW